MTTTDILMLTAGAVILTVCHALTLSSLMTFRRPMSSAVAVWSGAVVLTGVCAPIGLSLLPLRDAITVDFLVSVTVLSVTALLLTDFSPAKQCFLLVNYFNFYIFINSVSTLLALRTAHVYLYTALIRTALYAVLIFLSWRYLRPFVLSMEFPNERDWWPLTAAAGIFFALLANRTALASSVFFYDKPEDTIYLLVIFALLLATYLVLFRTVGYLRRLSAAETSALRSKLYEVQLASLREAEEDARRTRHDQRHHDLVVLEYLNAENYDGLRSYLGGAESVSVPSPYRRFCENDTVNCVLAAYYRKALAAELTVTVAAALPQEAALAPDDAVAILANLMENAIHGAECSGAAAPFLDLTVQSRAQKLVIECRNSCAPDTALKNGRPARSRGVGVDSILHAVRNYDGEAEFSAEDGVFTCRILLNLPIIPK